MLGRAYESHSANSGHQYKAENSWQKGQKLTQNLTAF